jgi:hypothetical protein
VAGRDDGERERAREVCQQIGSLRRPRAADEFVGRLVGESLEPRAEHVDAPDPERSIDEVAQPSMIGLVTQQHVGRHRLQVPRQPAEERPHPAAHGCRVLDEPVMVAEEVGDCRMGSGEPDRAEEREARADQRAGRAHPRERREGILLERLRGEIEPEDGRVREVHGVPRAVRVYRPSRRSATLGFCFAYGRPRNYAAARGGGADAPGGGRPVIHCLLGFWGGRTPSTWTGVNREYRDGKCSSLVLTQSK